MSNFHSTIVELSLKIIEVINKLDINLCTANYNDDKFCVQLFKSSEDFVMSVSSDDDNFKIARLFFQPYRRDIFPAIMISSGIECSVEFRDSVNGTEFLVIDTDSDKYKEEVLKLDDMSEEKLFQLSTIYDIPYSLDDIQKIMYDNPLTDGNSLLIRHLTDPEYQNTIISGFGAILSALIELKKQHDGV